MAAEVHATHAAGLVKMCGGPFQSLAAEPQQPQQPLAAGADVWIIDSVSQPTLNWVHVSPRAARYLVGLQDLHPRFKSGRRLQILQELVKGSRAATLRLLRKRPRAVRWNDPPRFQGAQVRRPAGKAICDPGENRPRIDGSGSGSQREVMVFRSIQPRGIARRRRSGFAKDRPIDHPAMPVLTGAI